jgi:hypothetical protein
VVKRHRRRVLWGLVVALFFATWVGGVRAHFGDLEASARSRYQMLQERNVERHGPYAGDEVPPHVRLLEGGPHTGIEWSVPILPGVLIVDSYEILGPLSAHGSTKLLVFDGSGFSIVFEWREWVT